MSDLPKPHAEMTDVELGKLLLRYVEARAPVHSPSPHPEERATGFDFIRAQVDQSDLKGADLRWIRLNSASLRGALLDEANLAHADLIDADLSGASLINADLRNAYLPTAKLRECNLNGVNLSGADLSGSNLTGCILDGALLRQTSSRRAIFQAASLVRVDLTGSELLGACLDDANLEEATLATCRLVDSSLRRVKGTGLRAREADFRGASLREATLVRADLQDCDFRGARLDGADLRGAVLSNAKLRGAELDGANLHGVKVDDDSLRGARLTYATYLASSAQPSDLARWVRLGAVVDLVEFPPVIVSSGFSDGQGLTLYFNTRLHRLDRILIEGIIVIVLGRSTDVDVAEYRREDENTIVRLTGSDPADLEAVANALWHRVWEEGFQQRTQVIENRGDVGTQINVAGDYLAPRELPELVARLEALQKVGGDLTALRDVLKRIELRLGQGEGETEYRREWAAPGDLEGG